MNETNAAPFVVGGAVQAGQGMYLVRDADRELLEYCRSSALVYILTARQLGKSSLMIHTAETLVDEGYIAIMVDLQSIGTPRHAEQWYRGVVQEIDAQAGLGNDVMSWWESHPELHVANRFTRLLQELVVLHGEKRITIFIDEIDTTLSLDYTDDFFAGIRFLYGERAINPDLQRLSFVLIGVAEPIDLIKDQQRTPFNIGSRLELSDFTLEEATPLCQGLDLEERERELVLRRVLYWTGGHPYLTLRVFSEIRAAPRQKWSKSAIDRFVQTLFLGEHGRGDHNLHFVRTMLTLQGAGRNRLLGLYARTHRGKVVPDVGADESVNRLKLSGVVRSQRGRLVIRNRIYEQVFTAKWAKANRTRDWPLHIRRLRYVAVTSSLLFVTVFVLGSIETTRIREEKHKAESKADELAKTTLMLEEKQSMLQKALRETQNLRAKDVAARLRADDYPLATVLVAEVLRDMLESKEPLSATLLDDLRSYLRQPLASVDESSEVKSVTISPDGRFVAVVTTEGACICTIDSTSSPNCHERISGEIEAMRFDPSSRRVVMATSDGEGTGVTIRQLDGAKLLVDLGKQTAKVNDIQFDAAGDRLVIALNDGKVRVWNVDGTAVSGFVGGHSEPVVTARFNTHGTHVVTASVDNTAAIHRVDGMGDDVLLQGHLAPLTDAMFTDDGRHVLTSSSDGEVRIWRTKDGSPVRIPGYGGVSVHARLGATGHQVLLRSSDGSAILRDMSTIESTEQILVGKYDEIVDSASMGNHLVAITVLRDGSIDVQDVAGMEHAVLPYHYGRIGKEFLVEKVSIATSRPRVVVASRRHVMVWDVARLGSAEVLMHRSSVSFAVFGARDERVATAADDNVVRLWPLGSEPADAKLLDGHTSSIVSLTFSPSRDRLLSTSEDGTARIWFVNDQDAPPLVLAGSDPVLVGGFSPDGALVVTGSENGTISIWAPDGDQAPMVRDGHSGSVLAMRFSTDGRTILAAYADGTVHLWTGKDFQKSLMLCRHEGSVIDAQFVPNTDLIGTASEDGTAKICRTDGSGEVRVLRHEGAVNSISFNARGDRFLTASEDSKARIWSLDDDEATFVLEHPTVSAAETNSVSHAEFSPDDSLVLTLAEHVRIWNGHDEGEPLLELKGHEDDVMSAHFSHGGDDVLTASLDGTVRVWHVNQKTIAHEMLDTLCKGTHTALSTDEWERYFTGRAFRHTCKGQAPKQLIAF